MKLFDLGKDADYYAQTLAQSLAIQNFLIGRNSLVSETKFLQLNHSRSLERLKLKQKQIDTRHDHLFCYS